MNKLNRPLSFALALVSLLCASCTEKSTTQAAQLKASSPGTFYCLESFNQYTSYFGLSSGQKVNVYVGTNPRQFQFAVHDPKGANATAILNGTTSITIPAIPQSVFVEAAKIEIQNNGGQNVDVCYEYVQ